MSVCLLGHGLADHVGVGCFRASEVMPVDPRSPRVEAAQRKRFSCQFFEGVCDDDFVLVDDLVAVELPTVVEGDQSISVWLRPTNVVTPT